MFENKPQSLAAQVIHPCYLYHLKCVSGTTTVPENMVVFWIIDERNCYVNKKNGHFKINTP